MEKEGKQLQDDFDSDLKDMVKTYQAFKKLGTMGGWVFAALMAGTAFVASAIEVYKYLIKHQ